MKKKLVVILVLAMFAVNSELMAGEKVGALGRIKPAGGIVNLVGQSGDIIADIMVKEGDFVEKGTQLVILRSKATQSLEVALAELAVEEADKLGKKAIAIQKLKVKVAKEDHELASKRLSRFERIGGDSVSKQETQLRESHVKTAQLNLDLAGQELQRLVLDRDIKVKRAINQLHVAREKLQNAVIKAPCDGTIIEILQNVGESTGSGTIITMADLRQIYVIADIFESDLLKLSLGQSVTITSNSLPKALTGQIESIGRVISEKSKVAKVKIRLNHSEVADKLINMEVNVSINL